MPKTTAAMRRKRLALLDPDVSVRYPQNPQQFLSLRLKRGRKVLRRTLSREETEYLVWMLGLYLWDLTEGACSEEDALLQAFRRGRAPWDFVQVKG